MKYSRNRWYVLLLLVLAGLAACDDSTTEPVDEAQILVDYVEANRGYDVHGGYIMSASDVRTAIVASPNDYYVIDIRAAADFADGHISGAVNVAMGDLPDHLANMSPAASTYDKVIVICYSGQTAAYSTGLLRALGHENVFSMKFGMSAWHTDFAAPWNGNISNERVTQFVTDASPAKNDPGALPTLSTGFEDGGSILEARVEQMFADGFGAATITDDVVFQAPEDYYIVNYWAQADYEGMGHIPGAIMYEPATTPWLFTTDLTTLPTDKTIVVYCYTGQTSAYVTSYLKTLGYDAKSLVFGANSMIHDVMAAAQSHAWGAGAIMDYEYDVMN